LGNLCDCFIFGMPSFLIHSAIINSAGGYGQNGSLNVIPAHPPCSAGVLLIPGCVSQSNSVYLTVLALLLLTMLLTLLLLTLLLTVLLTMLLTMLTLLLTVLLTVLTMLLTVLLTVLTMLLTVLTLLLTVLTLLLLTMLLTVLLTMLLTMLTMLLTVLLTLLTMLLTPFPNMSSPTMPSRTQLLLVVGCYSGKISQNFQYITRMNIPPTRQNPFSPISTL